METIINASLTEKLIAKDMLPPWKTFGTTFRISSWVKYAEKDINDIVGMVSKLLMKLESSKVLLVESGKKMTHVLK